MTVEKFVPPTPESIGARLSEQGTQENLKQETVQPETTMPFDISKMSREQLQSLKMALNATPDTVVRKRNGITIQLRETEMGEIVVWFGKVYKRYVQDPEKMAQVSMEMIKYKTVSEESPIMSEEKEMRYTDFMLLEKKTFDVVDIEINDKPEIIGEVTSRETGQLVDAVVNHVLRSYVVSFAGQKYVINQDNVN